MSKETETMRAIEIVEAGGPEVLQLAYRPKPQPGAGEVLIQVKAAGVNCPDIVQREGRYPPPEGVTDIPGLEVAGEVVKAGLGVGEWRSGDQVMALVAGGGYAEYVCAPAVQCLPLPRGWSMEEGAAFPETIFTVYHNVMERGRLEAGQKILVHGGSSGIGTTAVQLAVACGAQVAVTVKSQDKADLCKRLGAERTILYTEEKFEESIAEWTRGAGVQVVLCMVGGDYFPRNLDCLAPDGRLVQIATQKGAKSEISLVKLMTRRLTVTGSTLRARTVLEKGRIRSEIENQIWHWIESGKVRPILTKEFKLEDAADAHRYLESGSAMGKVVLTLS